ncbi:hypothetical protein CVT25_003575 [Psilocybe cyanescens]|uniref:Uncharacterized protein n=1 Tax=Psilocybe cyanescens TaxID=93625 RepID=A0A409WP05_PSICY|nr:hypothetical protein CVT25_003575 [Psilocybe cyanescens]
MSPPTLQDIMTGCYDPSNRKFEYTDLELSQLPLAAQDFLRLYGLEVTRKPHEELTEEGRDALFSQLLKIRKDERARLHETLCAVHLAIVTQMRNLASGDTAARATLRETLFPVWQSHLDDHLSRIDALLWFELEMRKCSQFRLLPQHYLSSRTEDINRMVSSALQWLQQEKERLEREDEAERARQLLALESNNSDEGSTEESSALDSRSEPEENLFSDSDAPLFSSIESDKPIPRRNAGNRRRLYAYYRII